MQREIDGMKRMIENEREKSTEVERLIGNERLHRQQS